MEKVGKYEETIIAEEIREIVEKELERNRNRREATENMALPFSVYLIEEMQ